MNDLTRMQCSEEIVVLGILRVVEEIRLKKPDAHIVINSLLPMIEFQSVEEPKMADVVDFKTGGDNVKKNMEIEKAVKDYVANAPPRPAPAPLMKGSEKATGGKRNLRAKEGAPKKMTKKQKQWEEDHASEGPALEKAMARAKKTLEKTDKRIVNKMFSDTEKYHPKKGVIPFLPIIKKSVLPPVWPAVHLINDKLREFCSKHDSITFFDATPIFASDEGRGRHHLHNELISPRGHPSDLGFAVWEGQIIGRLRKLIAEKEKEIEEKKAAAALSQLKEHDDDFQTDDEMGKEHVSEGKIAKPPPEPMEPPPRNDIPAKVEDEDEDEEGNGREHVSGGGKTASMPPEPMKQPPRDSLTDAVEEEEDDNEDDDAGIDDKVEVKKSDAVLKKETKAAEEKDDEDSDKDDDDDDDDDDKVDDKVEAKKSAPVVKKETKADKEEADDDDDDGEAGEDDDDDDEGDEEEEKESEPIAEEEEESASTPQFNKSTKKAKEVEDDDV